MQITKPDIIKKGEKGLIDSIIKNIDVKLIKKILEEKKSDKSSLSVKDGRLTIYKNKIAYQLNVDISLSSSLLFDRNGNYIDEAVKKTTQKTQATKNKAIIASKTLKNKTHSIKNVEEKSKKEEEPKTLEQPKTLETIKKNTNETKDTTNENTLAKESGTIDEDDLDKIFKEIETESYTDDGIDDIIKESSKIRENKGK